MNRLSEIQERDCEGTIHRTIAGHRPDQESAHRDAARQTLANPGLVMAQPTPGDAGGTWK